jgi:hypothetical protein
MLRANGGVCRGEEGVEGVEGRLMKPGVDVPARL